MYSAKILLYKVNDVVTILSGSRHEAVKHGYPWYPGPVPLPHTSMNHIAFTIRKELLNYTGNFVTNEVGNWIVSKLLRCRVRILL